MKTRIYINSETGHIDVDDDFSAVLAEFCTPMKYLFLQNGAIAIRKDSIRGIMKLEA